MHLQSVRGRRLRNLAKLLKIVEKLMETFKLWKVFVYYEDFLIKKIILIKIRELGVVMERKSFIILKEIKKASAKVLLVL